MTQEQADILISELQYLNRTLKDLLEHLRPRVEVGFSPVTCEYVGSHSWG